MLRQPPRSTLTTTLLPNTTPFRSLIQKARHSPQSTTPVIQRIGKAKPLRSPPPRPEKGDQLRQISLRPHARPRIVAHPRIGPVAATLLKPAQIGRAHV